LQASHPTGDYLTGYENYGSLFRLLGETVHQSCVLLTSREKPVEVSFIEDLQGRVRSLPLSGAWDTSIALITSRGLMGTEAEQRKLCELYACNPLALKIVAASIQTLFDRDIAAFLAEETIAFNGIRRLLDQQFERLSDLERRIMIWLAINREWVDLATLEADILPPVSRANLLEAVERLTWRSLIEQQAGHYTQQPVVMEYVLNHFVQTISTELATLTLKGFLRYALLKTTAKDYVQESQIRLILRPVAAQFRETFGSVTVQKQQIRQILTQLRHTETELPGYGCGNLMNLCHHLNLELTGYDFSHLTIRHSDLRELVLHHVKFSHCNLIHTVFREAFGGILGVALSQDGRLLVTGDTRYGIRVWEFPSGRLLAIGQEHQDWVWAVAVSPDGTTIASASADSTAKVWNPHGVCLQTLRGHQGWLWAIALSPTSVLVATGGADHVIRLWDRNTGQCLRILEGHEDWITALTWHPDGTMLASASQDKTLRLWDMEGRCLKTLRGHTDQIWGTAWDKDGTQLASVSLDQTIRIWNPQSGQCLQVISNPQGPMTKLVWNGDGQMLATNSLAYTHNIQVWHVPSGQCIKTLQGHISQIGALVWDHARNLLVSGSLDQTFRLWDGETGRCLKTIHSHKSRIWKLVWSPNGEQLATASENRTISIWEVATRRCCRELHGH